ncbi:MAG: DUF5666 domain-containing protein [Methylotetracoccus sp.]
MKPLRDLFLPVLLLLAPAAMADEEFYGRLESRPTGKAGTWVVGGRQLAVTDNTRLDEDDGPLVVGACVEVEYANGAIKEIESEDDAKKCGK